MIKLTPTFDFQTTDPICIGIRTWVKNEEDPTVAGRVGEGHVEPEHLQALGVILLLQVPEVLPGLLETGRLLDEEVDVAKDGGFAALMRSHRTSQLTTSPRGCGCSTAVEHTLHNQKIMGSNPAWC